MNEFIERISKLSPKRLVLLAAELQARLQAAEEAAGSANTGAAQEASGSHDAVAVIGMGLRFPGGAQSPEEFWDFLCRGGDGIRKTPAARWDVDALYDPDPDAPGKLATQWGGFVDGIDQFDPQLFGITPREAASMDPQQRMMLETAWEALERAGYAPDRLGGSPTGVFVGACNGDYYQMVLQSGDENLEMYTATGSAHSVISGRISYLLGLQGPSLTVDTACSSSLVAIHLACQSLRSGECRMALAGGVNAILAPDTTVVLSKAKMMAPDGRCKAFDARADGFVRSEGCGVVVLKRLADAEADGDQILAVVRGTAINQDGRSNGLTAPNGPSQVAVLRAALDDAGVQPAAVGYVETHGTGTSLGDPIEVQALAEALGTDRPAERPLLIGSVKTNIGHLESAAGVAGFIKLVLALQHRTIPPHLHLQQLNPYIAWDELPVQVPADGAGWEAINGRWLGGVSSFGFSGTNVHMVLEAASPPADQGQEQAEDRPLHLLQLSARSKGALEAQARNFAAFLATNDVDLADAACTANTGRALFAHRLALVAAAREEAQAKLQAFATDAAATSEAPGASGGISYGHVPGNRKPSVAFLFSGHGGQYAGMGRELYATQGAFRSAFDQCDALFRPLLATPLSVMFEPVAPGALTPWMQSMTFAQPALFALQYALAAMWRSWGVEPAAVAGHSIGEYAAACVAGVLRLEDAVTLVAARSRLMDAIPANGAMMAVFADEATVAAAVAPYADRVAIAAINGPQAIVISGVTEAVEAVAADLARSKVRSRRLAVAQGAHSPLIDTVLDEFGAVTASVAYAEPQITFVSSLFGRAVDDGEISNGDYWRRHLRETVRFADAVHALDAAGSNAYVEIGPSPMLIALGQRCLPEGEGEASARIWASSLRPATTTGAPAGTAAPHDEWRQVLDSAAALFTFGVEIDWAAFDRPYARRRLTLPTYPFERQRYWFTTGSPRRQVQSMHSPRHPLTSSSAHPLLSRRLRSPALHDIVFETEIGRYEPAFLDHHSIFGVVILPSPAYLEMALSAAAQLFGQEPYAVANFTIHTPLLLPEEGTRTVQLVIGQPVSSAAGDSRSFQVMAWDEAAGDWKLHASGELERQPVAAAPAAPFSSSAVQGRCPHTITGADYYEQVRALGLTFGESFRGIRDVWIGEGEALGRIELPAALVEEAGRYRFHPALLDACFHLLGAPLAKNGMDAAYLLIGIDRFQLHRAPGPVLWNHTRIVQLPGRRAETFTETFAETFTGDILLYDNEGQLVAEAHGLQLKRADRSTLLRAVGQRPKDWLYGVQWQPHPLTEQRETLSGSSFHPTNRGSDAPWLIFADAAGVGRSLAQSLQGRGDRCVLVEETGEDPYTADRLTALLAQPDLRGLHRVVYLGGYASEGAAEEEGNEGRTTAALLHLIQALVRGGQPLAGGLWLATKEAQPAVTAPTAAGVHGSPLWGLGRVAALEQPQMWGGMVDLDAADPQRAAELLLAELDAGDGEDQVAWRDGQRYVARLVRWSQAQAAAPEGAALRRDRSYLVTGGLGGLGLEVARWLAQHGAGHLVLMGRRGLPAREQWPHLAHDAAWGRQVGAVTAIERLGTAVTVLAADMADDGAMAALFGRFGDDLPPLAGIIHTAADLSSAPIADLADASLLAMLRPKVRGTWNLHRFSAHLPLDFFVLFSSTTALLGANGLAHYAAANAFLDSFAHWRRSQALPALSVNWGTWSVMRAASAAEQQRAAEFGLEQMPADLALAVLGDFLLAAPGAQVPAQLTVAAVNWDALKPAYEARRRRPLLALIETRSAQAAAAQETGGAAAGSAGSAGSDVAAEPPLLAAYRAAPPDERADLLVAALRTAVAKIVGMADPAAIDLHQGLFEMGMDSLMSVELKTRLERQVGKALPSTLTFNYPTISDLAGYLEKQVLGPALAATAAASANAEPASSAHPEPASAPAAPPVAPADEGELDELSEDELAARLMQRLSQFR